MNPREAFLLSLDMADMVCQTYLGDLSDSDLMQRPHAECNHINWQLGHLIASEHEMMAKIYPAIIPSLPAGFAEKYSRETAGGNDPSAFETKEVLMATYKAQREGTKAALATVQDSDFDQPTGIHYAPTIGSLFALQGSHWLMHCGQWVIVRRNLGKPVVI